MQNTFDIVCNADTGEILFVNLDVVVSLPFLPEEIARQAIDKMERLAPTIACQHVVLMDGYNPTLLASCQTEVLDGQRVIKLNLLDVKFHSKQLTSLTALVVDDNVDNRRLLENIVKKLGLEVTCAPDGYAALKQASNRLFDFIFMDINMPGMNGIQTTRRVRALPNGKMPYIIATTALSAPEGASKFLECGMNSTLPKPLSIDSVKSKITELLHLNRPQNASRAKSHTQLSAFSDLEKLAIRLSLAM